MNRPGLAPRVSIMASSSAPRRGRASVAFGSEAEVLPAGSATTHSTPSGRTPTNAHAAAEFSPPRVDTPDMYGEVVRSVTDEAERGTRAAKRRRAGDLEVIDVGLRAVSRPWWRTLAKLGPRGRAHARVIATGPASRVLSVADEVADGA